MKLNLLPFSVAIFILCSCAGTLNLLQTNIQLPLTEDEVVNGLKEALTTGSKNSANILGAVDGYFGDITVKILLPDEARVITDNLSKLPGGDKLVRDVILRINRAAEDAAREAAPIFAGSIKRMTVRDGFNILNGPDNAATQYLRQTTYNELYSLYKPKIAVSTEKDIAGSVAGRLAGLKPVNADLDDFLIRKEVSARISPVLQRVFGSLDNKPK